MNRSYSFKELALFLTSHELFIRTVWLIWLVFSTVYQLGTVLFRFHETLQTFSLAFAYTLAFAELTLISLVTYAYYYCAYKKHGTILLGFSLIFGFVSLYILPVLLYFNIARPAELASQLSWWDLIACPLMVWLYYRFLQVNRKIQMNSYLASDLYVYDVSCLQRAENATALMETYKSRIRHLGSDCAAVLFIEYNSKLTQLSSVPK